MGESESFTMGVAGIIVSLFFVLVGWMPSYILFGVLVIAGLLYNTKFFSTGIIGGFGSGVFSAFGWLPPFIYFTVVVLASVLLSARVAGLYVNTGQNK